MKKIMTGILILFVLFVSDSLFAFETKDIELPSSLKTKCYVRSIEREGLWEKTLVLIFGEERRVLSTNEGFLVAKVAINHSAHPDIWKKVCDELKTKKEPGGVVYIRKVKEEIGRSLNLEPLNIAELATAANMDNLSVITKEYPPYLVSALVTAGARSNALRTGLDEGPYIEEDEKFGTVNIIILTNAQLSDGAMARAVITATEAKTAAFQDLNIPSSYTKGAQATGTGTDSVLVVSAKDGPKVRYTGGHSKMGELIGKAVYEAVCVALERQNGFKRQR